MFKSITAAAFRLSTRCRPSSMPSLSGCPSFSAAAGVASPVRSASQLLLKLQTTSHRDFCSQWQRQPRVREQPDRRQRTQASANHRDAPQLHSQRGKTNRNDNQTFYVTCHPGLEEAVADELVASHIGASGIQLGKAGVYFRGTQVTGYKANMWIRCGIRVLQLLSQGTLDSYRAGGSELYRLTRDAAEWPQLLRQGQSFSVDARIGGCSDVPTESLVRTRVKDAICDAMRDARRDKPMPPEPGQLADMPLFVSCFQDHMMIYRDMSGNSLHRRGYRSAMHRASLNECAAAGILYLAGWHEKVAHDSGAVIADPMCGSGTFLIEAALMARDIAPGLFRSSWAFQQWPDFDAAAWRDVQGAAEAAEQPWEGSALGCDIHEGALSLALRDAKAAGVIRGFGLRHGAAASWQLPQRPSLTVVNPPWGQRLLDRQEGEDLVSAWQELATFFREQCHDSEVYVLSGEGSKFATRNLRMKADWRKPITIGGVDTRLLKYRVLPKMTAEKFAERGATLGLQ